GQRNEQEIGEREDEAVSRTELQLRQQVDGPGSDGKCSRLDYEQRLWMRVGDVERHQQQEDRREVVSEIGVRLGQRLAHRRFEESALRRVPENLVEEPEIEAKGVVGPVSEDCQRA